MEIEPHRILVIDDQISQSKSDRADFLEAIGYYKSAESGKRSVGYPYEFNFHTGQTESGRNSIDAVKAAILHNWPSEDGKRWALVLLDVRFDEKSGRSDDEFGFTLLRALREDPRFGYDLAIVMLTSEGNGKKSAAGKLNADDFFPKSDGAGKPLWSEEGLRNIVNRTGLISDDRDKASFETTNSARLLGQSLPLLKVLRDARRFALNPRAKRILYGESGSGKTWLAAYIHHFAKRSGPFIRWTADPASKDTVKAELFGHWKGAFTGASHNLAGKIERAHLGTFFLDEVANLPIEVQKALLQMRDPDAKGNRLLSRLGNFPSDDSQRHAAMNSMAEGIRLVHGDYLQVNVLLFPGTNRNLDDPVEREQNTFQSDLLWDFGTPLRFPSLNERRDDVLFLFQSFARRVAVSQSVEVPTDLPIEKSVLDLLRNRNWSDKGNVRDLKRIAEFAASRFGAFGQIRFTDLPPDVKGTEEIHVKPTPSSPPEKQVDVPAAFPQASANIANFLDPLAGALKRAELAHLRHRAQLLADAAEATRRIDKTGEKTKYQPSVAITRLMGNDIKGSDPRRFIKTNILGPIFHPTKKMLNAFGKTEFESIQAWANARPVLVALYRYAIKEIDADEI